MKKLLTLLLALTLTLSLTACGGKEEAPAPAPSQGTRQSAPTPSGGVADPAPQQAAKGELYDITDDQIGASERDANYSYKKVEGDKRAEMLAAFPSAMKKGIGEIAKCSISRAEGYKNCTVGLQFEVNDDGDYKTLTDYYKSLDGTVSGESDSMLTMDFAWGSIAQCDYLDSSKEITVTLSINE